MVLALSRPCSGIERMWSHSWTRHVDEFLSFAVNKTTIENEGSRAKNGLYRCDATRIGQDSPLLVPGISWIAYGSRGHAVLGVTTWRCCFRPRQMRGSRRGEPVICTSQMRISLAIVLLPTSGVCVRSRNIRAQASA